VTVTVEEGSSRIPIHPDTQSGDREAARGSRWRPKNLVPPQAAVLAPMSGISDGPFRLLAGDYGAHLVYTEMVSAEGLVRGNSQCRAMITPDRGEGPVVGQIYGTDPALMAEAAVVARELGVEAVDVNVGCPALKVVRLGAGAALMKTPDRLKAILTAVRAAVNIPVGIKIRSGWCRGSINASLIARVAQDCGVDMVAVHPRPRSQGFSGSADWEVIRVVKESTDMVVIGNGDIRSAAEATRMVRETGCDAVMIGRASRGDPWIFARIRAGMDGRPGPPPPTLEEREGVVYRHLGLAVPVGDEGTVVARFVRHVCCYVRGLPGASAFRKRLQGVKGRDDLRDLVAAYFARLRTLREVEGCWSDPPTSTSIWRNLFERLE